MALRDKQKKEAAETADKETTEQKKVVKKPAPKKPEPKEEPKEAEVKEAEAEEAEAEEKAEEKEEAPKVAVKQEVKAQPNVRIKLARDINTFVGDKWYRFKKGETATVPSNVKDILKTAGCLEAI